MKRIAVISLLAATALLGSCRFVTIKDSESSSSKGVSASETTRKADEEKIVNRYDVGEFDSVVCSGAFDINYNSGSCEVKVEATEREMDGLKVYVEDRTLHMEFTKKNLLGKKSDIDVYMRSDTLNSLEINGAAEFESHGGIKAGKQFNLTVNGASDIEIDSLEAEFIRINTNGAADAKIAGINASELNIQVNGAADIRLAGKTVSTQIEINGAGDIDTSHLQSESFSKRVNGRVVR